MKMQNFSFMVVLDCFNTTEIGMDFSSNILVSWDWPNVANIKWIAFGRLSLLHCAFPEKSGFSSAVIGVITMSFLVWPLAIQSVPFPAKSVTLGVPKIRWKISCFNPRPTKCTLQDLTEFHIFFFCFRNRADYSGAPVAFNTWCGHHYSVGIICLPWLR